MKKIFKYILDILRWILVIPVSFFIYTLVTSWGYQKVRFELKDTDGGWFVESEYFLLTLVFSALGAIIFLSGANIAPRYKKLTAVGLFLLFFIYAIVATFKPIVPFIQMGFSDYCNQVVCFYSFDKAQAVTTFAILLIMLLGILASLTKDDVDELFNE